MLLCGVLFRVPGDNAGEETSWNILFKERVALIKLIN
jgi:hypothetical protein